MKPRHQQDQLSRFPGCLPDTNPRPHPRMPAPKTTIRDLEALFLKLNSLAGTPQTHTTDADFGKSTEFCIGSYYLSAGFFGYAVKQVTSPKGSFRSIFVGTKRELHLFLLGYLQGFQDGYAHHKELTQTQQASTNPQHLKAS